MERTGERDGGDGSGGAGVKKGRCEVRGVRCEVLGVLLLASLAGAQTKVDAERQIAGTASTVAGRILVWLPAGPVRVANLDESQFEIVAPTPTSGPVLRLKTPPQAAIREKAVRLTFSGGSVALPDAPLAGTVVKISWNGLLQDPTSDYTVSGNVVTPAAGRWIAGDVLVVVYFH